MPTLPEDTNDFGDDGGTGSAQGTTPTNMDELGMAEVSEVSMGGEEGGLPPEARGEANGGPLGCCLGTTIGLLLCVSIALLSRFYADPLAHLLGGALSVVTRILMVFVAVVGVLVCGYFGWKVGKNVYREYNSPIISENGKLKS